jgi:ADP-heptose:LPS heptosyltransferase
MQNHIKNKVVIYHTGALGDLLISTAALSESLKIFSKETEITVVGNALWKEILLPSEWPQIHFILQIENKKWNNATLWKSNLEKNIWMEAPLLFSSFHKFLKQFDTSIDFRSESLRFAIQSFLARIPKRIGASKNTFARFLFTDFSLEEKSKKNHERDRYLKIISSVSRTSRSDKGLPQLKKFDEGDFTKKTGFPAGKIILINPTASIRAKAWASDSFRSLALLLKNKGYDVFIIGSPKETSWLKEVAGQDCQILQPNRILDLVNLVFGSRLLITNTSSMQFIAAGTGTFVVTLMGSANPEIWGPVGKECIHIKCCDHSVLDEKAAYEFIPVEIVFNTVLDILKNDKKSRSSNSLV